MHFTSLLWLLKEFWGWNLQNFVPLASAYAFSWRPIFLKPELQLQPNVKNTVSVILWFSSYGAMAYRLVFYKGSVETSKKDRFLWNKQSKTLFRSAQARFKTDHCSSYTELGHIITNYPMIRGWWQEFFFSSPAAVATNGWRVLELIEPKNIWVTKKTLGLGSASKDLRLF